MECHVPRRSRIKISFLGSDRLRQDRTNGGGTLSSVHLCLLRQQVTPSARSSRLPTTPPTIPPMTPPLSVFELVVPGVEELLMMLAITDEVEAALEEDVDIRDVVMDVDDVVAAEEEIVVDVDDAEEAMAEV